MRARLSVLLVLHIVLDFRSSLGRSVEPRGCSAARRRRQALFLSGLVNSKEGCHLATDTPKRESISHLADVRARETEAEMTDEERFSLLVSVMGANTWIRERDPRIPEGTPMSAGYVPGVPRLGVPALLMSDASLGVTNPGYREGDTATALPAGMALASTFNPELARQSGAVVGREARSKGFNVQLAGGINLARDPRNGRNFEYLSEDPLVERRNGSGVDQWYSGRRGHLDDQALLAQLQRDQPALARRHHRPGGAPRV